MPGKMALLNVGTKIKINQSTNQDCVILCCMNLTNVITHEYYFYKSQSISQSVSQSINQSINQLSLIKTVLSCDEFN